MEIIVACAIYTAYAALEAKSTDARSVQPPIGNQMARMPSVCIATAYKKALLAPSFFTAKPAASAPAKPNIVPYMCKTSPISSSFQPISTSIGLSSPNAAQIPIDCTKSTLSQAFLPLKKPNIALKSSPSPAFTRSGSLKKARLSKETAIKDVKNKFASLQPNFA